MHTSVNANLVAEIPEQDFYFVDIPNLVSGWPNGRSDVSPVRFRYGKLPLIRAACAVHDNLIKSLLRDCWSADRKRHEKSCGCVGRILIELEIPLDASSIKRQPIIWVRNKNFSFLSNSAVARYSIQRS
jgi:hypothetical protein